MSFWNSEKLRERQTIKKLIDPFEQECVKHGAYELSLGEQAVVTSDPTGIKRKLETGEQLIIPPGQFGLLLTRETVSIPDNAIGFISIRFSIKCRGLVNVSGFHVDPGYAGRLEFAVYNAGSQNIILSCGERVFMIWFSDLSGPTKDVYDGRNAARTEITSEDSMLIQGKVASPAALKQEIEELRNLNEQRLTGIEKEISLWKTLMASLIVAIIILFVKAFLEGRPAPANPPPVSTESAPSREPIQNLNRNESPLVEKNGNTASPTTNKSESKPARRK
jgi:dCTP deaminase